MQLSRTNVRWLPLVAAACALGILLLVLLPLPNPPSLDDGLRHVTVARIMAQEGIGSVHGWGDFLTAGYFSERNTDPWFLSDVVLMPLQHFSNVTALKIVITVSILLLTTVMLFFLRTLKISQVAAGVLMLLLLLGEPKFTERLFIARPFLLMTCLALITLMCVLYRKWKPVLPLLCLAVLLSQLFVIPAGICVLGCAWLWSLREKRSAVLLLLSLLGGIGLGMLFHPSPLTYAHYLGTVFLRIPFMFSRRAEMGSEMFSSLASGPSMVEPFAAIILLMTVFAAYRMHISLKTMHRSGITFSATLAGGLLVMFFFWMRAIDVLWPVMIVLCAQLLSLAPDLPQKMVRSFSPRFPLRTARICLLSLLLVCSIRTAHALTNIITINPLLSPARFAALAVVPQGSKVLNLDWDLFPLYFSLRPDVKFATGIDVNLTAFTDAEAADLMAEPAAWEREPETMPEDLTPWIVSLTQHLPGEYLVLASWRYRALIKELKHASSLSLMTGQENGLTIFRISSEVLPQP